jgi:renalase
MYEVVIVGAGVAGLTCARQLQRAAGEKSGRSIVVLDKSHGLGGRLATRRLANTHADHGVCYLKAQGNQFQKEIEELVTAGVLRVWSERIHRLDTDGVLHPPSKFSPCYAAPAGATAIAKHWARGIEVLNDRTITRIQPAEHGWQIEASGGSIAAQQVVIAVPPAQAIEIAADVVDAICLRKLQGVLFAPSIAAIATYSADFRRAAANLEWQGIQCVGHRSLGWIGLDSSKQLEPSQPVLVVQSNGEFAAEHLEAKDRLAIGQQLLENAAILAPWFAQPELLQVHRWAYAFAQNPLAEKFLEANTAMPLYFCGDWCGGDRVEAAYLSGLAVAERIL